MTSDPNAPATPAAKKPGPSLALSLALITLGTIIGVTGLTVGIVKVVHDAKVVAAGQAPETVRAHLGSGTWEVYTDSFGGLEPDDVSISSASHGTIAVRDTGNVIETRTYRGESYTGQAKFSVTQAGDYTIRVSNSETVNFIVARTFGGAARAGAGWFVMTGLGFLIGLLGVIVLIVGILRRRSAKRLPFVAGAGYPVATFAGSGYPTPVPGQPVSPPAWQAPQPQLPPAGWYPDPSIPGSTRWWDGTRWTDQTQSPT